MNLTTMLQDLLKSLFGKPATVTTEADTAQRLRGKVHWNPDNCTGCQLCVKDCPSNALDLFVIDKKNKQFVMRYDLGRCTYCAQCVASCRFDCITLQSDEWSLATDNIEDFKVDYGDKDLVQSMEKETSNAD